MLFRDISRSLVILGLAVLSQFALAIEDARSDQTKHEDGDIKISVRAIQASEPCASETARVDNDRKIHFDKSISDLEARLSQLPFNHFQLLSTKEETLASKARDSVQLPNGHTLMFRPIYADHKKAGLWIDWRDRDGSEILNTRIHFDTEDSILTGTDCSSDKGLILAIRAAAAQ
jgi:hypothetical protein